MAGVVTNNIDIQRIKMLGKLFSHLGRIEDYEPYTVCASVVDVFFENPDAWSAIKELRITCSNGHSVCLKIGSGGFNIYTSSSLGGVHLCIIPVQGKRYAEVRVYGVRVSATRKSATRKVIVPEAMHVIVESGRLRDALVKICETIFRSGGSPGHSIMAVIAENVEPTALLAYDGENDVYVVQVGSEVSAFAPDGLEPVSGRIGKLSNLAFAVMGALTTGESDVAEVVKGMLSGATGVREILAPYTLASEDIIGCR